jgi:hypothetical protein
MRQEIDGMLLLVELWIIATAVDDRDGGIEKCG